MKPFLTDKGVSKNSIKLIEGSKIIVEDCEVADTLNIYFNNAVTSLGINESADIITETQNINDAIETILLKFSNHRSILMINAIQINSTFSFHLTSLTEILNEINNLNTKISNPENTVSAKHLKEHIDVSSNILHEMINFCIINSKV